MRINKLVNYLCDLNTTDFAGGTNLNDFYEEKYQEICTQIKFSPQDIENSIGEITSLYFSTEEVAEWKYISLSFYIFYLINQELQASDGEVLSVQHNKNIKNFLQHLVTVGIYSKLQPNLPFHVDTLQPESEDIFLKYNILKCTTFGLCQFLRYPWIRLLILPDSLKAILVAAYQISFCPLKKPGPENNLITEEIYSVLLSERQVFLKLLIHLRETIYPTIFVKENMVILRSNAPSWFKKCVSQSLTTIIRSKDGVKHIAVVLLDGANDDSTQTWEIFDVFVKLFLGCRKFPDFQENICKQILNLLDNVGEETLVFERLFVHCTKTLYLHDQDLAKNIFIRRIVSYLLYFTYKDHKFSDHENITENIKQIIRITHKLFVENTVVSPKLPIEILKPVVNVLFRLYGFTSNSPLKSTHNQIGEILRTFMRSEPKYIFSLFDSFLFGINSKEILAFRNDISIRSDKNAIVLNYSKHALRYSVSENSEYLLELLKTEPMMIVDLFGYLLNCLTERDKYFIKTNEDLLNLEDTFMTEFFERNLQIFKLLSDLAEDKNVQKQVTENPKQIIKYMNNTFGKFLEASVHKTNDFESEGFQSLFTIVMILEVLVTNTSKSNLGEFKILIESLQKIAKESRNCELTSLVDKILGVLEKSPGQSSSSVGEIKSDLDKAIDEICDPLLPVRGHGLMALQKLVEQKDKLTMERKMYVLNIFQQNLKNTDSFVYLSAIAGLTSMADIYPDIILNILCEEYSDSSRKTKEDDGHEVRMKLGETLLRVTKTLGEMATKYKALLLNTFLISAKDDDHLIRASSLSNLGEICRVLGYKLGSVVTEILVCIHAVISTDKSLEARRAAVTVIRQLLVGLDKEMISFLKEDILPIYRTLKEIYNNDKDDVMRLQAQLALEELNENMKNFVFPKPQLNMEKNIVMLN